MASVNNIYLTAGDPVVKYIKTIQSKVSGMRFDALREQTFPTSFVLESEPNVFDYDKEVLELYSEKEHRYFKQANRALIEQGLLRVFTDEAPELLTNNFLSEEDIEDIAATRALPTLERRLEELTSVAAVNRVLEAVNRIGRPKKYIDAVEKRMADLRQE